MKWTIRLHVKGFTEHLYTRSAYCISNDASFQIRKLHSSRADHPGTAAHLENKTYLI